MGDNDMCAGGGDDDDDDDDDIARFEKQCAERARAQGLALTESGGHGQDSGSDSDDDDADAQLGRARAAVGVGGIPRASPREGGDAALSRRCEQLESRLKRREAELAQARSDLDLLKSDGSAVPGDIVGELKQRLLDLTKKNRRLNVTAESQKARVQQLEAELKRPREEAKRIADEALAEKASVALGDGFEDWKRKYLAASNKLQEVRHEVQELRAQVQKQKKVLVRELGSEEAVANALAVVDDPAAAQFRGRAQQISQLQRQVRELRDQLRKNGDGGDEADDGESNPSQRPRGGAGGGVSAAPPPEKVTVGLAQAAEKRREEFDRMQEEVEKLRQEQGDGKRKRDALKSRNGVLEGQVRELRSHVQTIVQKSENDDELVAALRKQVGRPAVPPSGNGSYLPSGDDLEALRREKEELQAQLDRQAQIVVQLRTKNINAACENGSVRLGPKSVEGLAGERALVERVRYLEAENSRQSEQVRLYKEQAARESTPGSADRDRMRGEREGRLPRRQGTGDSMGRGGHGCSSSPGGSEGSVSLRVTSVGNSYAGFDDYDA
eukprot:TRINITY_DN14547_c0_g1_i1.p1 TRINITY_DN14547_c0_g1~~TRINITY_DN14547_c0_g1_i1.p1  ORF type:complete len:555 (-),score=150.38 TRINITY_DN14547_c0_g1_i1:102-1766(-)